MRQTFNTRLSHLLVMLFLVGAFSPGCGMIAQNKEEKALRAVLLENPGDSESRANLATLLYDRGEREEVVRLLEEGLRLSPEDTSMRWQLALTYSRWGRETDEQKYHSRARVHWEHYIGQDPDNAKAHCNLGHTLGALGMHAKAADAYNRAAMLDPEEISHLAEAAYAYKESGRYEKSLPMMQELAQRHPDDHKYHLWLGDNYRLLGDYETAAKHMEIACKVGSPKTRARAREFLAYTQLLMETERSWDAFVSHFNMAHRHRGIDRPDREAAEYKAAVEVWPDDSDSYTHLGWCYLFMAQFESHVSNHEKALEYAKLAVEAYTKTNDMTSMAFGYETLAGEYTSLAEMQQDQELYQSALRARERQYECAKEAGHILQIIYATAGRANTLRHLYGLEDERTREWRANLLPFLPKPGDGIHEGMGIAAHTEAIFRMHEKDNQGARELLEMLFDFYCRDLDIRSVKSAPHIFNMLTTIAVLEEDFDTAIGYGERAVERLGLIRAHLGADEFRRNVGGEIWRVAFAENLIQCALGKSDPVAAFGYSEQYKGRTLLDLLGGGAADSRRMVLRRKRADAQSLSARVQGIEEQILEARATGQETVLRSLERTLTIEKTSYERLRQDVAAAERDIVLFEQAEPVALEEIQELAARHDFTFVTYVVALWGTAATVVTGDAVHAVALKDAKQEVLGDAMIACLPGLGLDVSEALRDLNIELDGIAPRPDSEAAAREALEENTALLYTLLVEPILPYIDTELVYISPDAFLNRLPFEVLHRDGKYLAEQFAIAYAPSASVLKVCLDRDRNARSSVLALGNPNLKNPAFRLVHAENEVHAIEGLFPDSQILTFDAATETAVKELAQRYDVLHLACHGELNYDEPMLTSLRLAPDDENDGYLHAGELFDLDLNASLVVLSACNSGLGEVSTGNELMGLTRGFLAAGAPSIVATLWTVDDRSTAFLMQRFYENLDGMTKAEALRQARLTTMKEYPNPFHWAPFVLIGDAR